jgi:hypothetical protein
MMGGHTQVDVIARVCHEANRALCEATGDHSQPLWSDAPEWQRDSARDGVRYLMDHPHANHSATHENWRSFKEKDGWTWGPVKDAAKREHPCMVPFHELPPEQQLKDVVFSALVRAMT